MKKDRKKETKNEENFTYESAIRYDGFGQNPNRIHVKGRSPVKFEDCSWH
jgi:hypothetical protein